MRKTELVAQVSERTGLTKKDTGTCVDAVVEVIAETLKSGDYVRLPGFASFRPITRDSHTGFDPHTKKTIDIPSKNYVRFLTSKNFINFLNN